MTRITRWLILVGAVFFASFQLGFPEDPAHTDTRTATRTADEQEIYATVIRNSMEQWIQTAEKEEAGAKAKWEKSSAKNMNFRVFFVSINGKDPSDSFLRRLHDIPRQIRKASRGQVTIHGVLDKETQQAGIIFNAADIRWSSRGDAAEVHGGYWCGGRCGASILFSVRRENSKWEVKELEMQGQS